MKYILDKSWKKKRSLAVEENCFIPPEVIICLHGYKKKKPKYKPSWKGIYCILQLEIIAIKSGKQIIENHSISEVSIINTPPQAEANISRMPSLHTVE